VLLPIIGNLLNFLNVPAGEPDPATDWYLLRWFGGAVSAMFLAS
jgi:hypothetical protein